METLLKRDRALVIAGIAVISALAWLSMLYLAPGMQGGMQAMSMEMVKPRLQSWGGVDLLLMFIMWTVMMIAMMTPSAAPMILMFATVNQRRGDQEGPIISTGLFLTGYLIVWTGFSAVATFAQWQLHAAALLSPAMTSASPVLGGWLLIGAGVFQWTPLKRACLKRCRTPLGFLMTCWRDGRRGAVAMGLHHGAFCVGCCWILMGLLFVAGVMNLLWVAAVAAFVLVEKALPRGAWIGRAMGSVLIVWGAVMLMG